jgi:hypothetical protein
MLDSANDTIAALKAELGDLAVEAEEARRAAEEAEAAAARAGEEDAAEKANLRYEEVQVHQVFHCTSGVICCCTSAYLLKQMMSSHKQD